MRENFDHCLRHVLSHEGGYVDHPLDPGGATNFGITHKTLARWRGAPVTKRDVQNLALGEVAEIYHARYWENVMGDELPHGLDLTVFDFAVNSGPARATKFIQRKVREKVDGIFGPMTLRAVLRVNNVRGLIADVNDARLHWLHGLTNWKTFGKGWKRRVLSIKAESLEMFDRAWANPDQEEGK